jgi:hypothetical protein
MAAEAEKPTAGTMAGLKVWQALLLYPAILTSIGGAIPTALNWIKAWRLEVNYSKVHQAEEQKRLWTRNLDCLEAKPVYSVEGPHGETFGATLCPSGDALLRYETEGGITYTWIPYPTPAAKKQTSLLGQAHAQGEPPTPLLRSRIVWGATRCAFQREIVVIRIYTLDGKSCLVEHVLMATGVVVSSVPVGCSLTCLELEGRQARQVRREGR